MESMEAATSSAAQCKQKLVADAMKEEENNNNMSEKIKMVIDRYTYQIAVQVAFRISRACGSVSSRTNGTGNCIDQKKKKKTTSKESGRKK